MATKRQKRRKLKDEKLRLKLIKGIKKSLTEKATEKATRRIVQFPQRRSLISRIAKPVAAAGLTVAALKSAGCTGDITYWYGQQRFIGDKVETKGDAGLQGITISTEGRTENGRHGVRTSLGISQGGIEDPVVNVDTREYGAGVYWVARFRAKEPVFKNVGERIPVYEESLVKARTENLGAERKRNKDAYGRAVFSQGRYKYRLETDPKFSETYVAKLEKDLERINKELADPNLTDPVKRRQLENEKGKIEGIKTERKNLKDMVAREAQTSIEALMAGQEIGEKSLKLEEELAAAKLKADNIRERIKDRGNKGSGYFVLGPEYIEKVADVYAAGLIDKTERDAMLGIYTGLGWEKAFTRGTLKMEAGLTLPFSEEGNARWRAMIGFSK